MDLVKTNSSQEYLSGRNKFSLLLLKFTSNFNESLLTAEITQTFFKVLGVNVWSSTVIWIFPPLFYLVVAPFYRRYLMTKNYDTFLNNMVSLSVLFFLNSIGFITLFNLESLTANKQVASGLMVLLGSIAFTVTDVSKMIYELLVFDYMMEYIEKKKHRMLEYYGIIAETSGKTFGAFISCLYIVGQKTNFTRFSDDFYTNMQFCYYFATCLNALTVFWIFLFWPKNLAYSPHTIDHKATSVLEFFFPNFKNIPLLEKHNQKMLIRLFFIVGIYWCIAVNLTQWISNKFMDDYPDDIDKSSMQAIDVGTAWGSIPLSIFYCLWGMQHLVMFPLKKRLSKFSRLITRVLNLVGAAIYTLCYCIYDGDVKYLIVLLGLGGISYDFLLVEKIRDSLTNDISLSKETPQERDRIVRNIFWIIEFMSEFMFFFFLPVIFQTLDDEFWVIGLAAIQLVMAIMVPREMIALI
jgi:hypothetical protein